MMYPEVVYCVCDVAYLIYINVFDRVCKGQGVGGQRALLR